MATSNTVENAASPHLASEAEEKRRSPSPRRNARHAKGLSLNFPILLPAQLPSSTNSPRTASPTNPSSTASPKFKAGSTPVMQDLAQTANRTSADFLTLVAAQERKVLELREELAKADSELTALKKQWAIYEANKKREEVRQVRRMPVPLDEVPSPSSTDKRGLEEERRRRRALVEMSNNTSGQMQGNPSLPGRRGSKRIFEGKHTRTLSLLSPTAKKPAAGRSLDEILVSDENLEAEDSASDQIPGTPSLSRMPTLDGLVSPEHLQLGFGKTYKTLASHRRSLPPGTADMFMKQGKQVVDGVREGLWTFFEDIRQATVGDEAVNGPAPQQRHSRHSKNLQPTRRKSKSGKSNSKVPPTTESFWREFGLNTPKKSVDAERETRTTHVQQKSSTDSSNPPDLLEDVNGDEHDEDDWDHWESPTTTSKVAQVETAPLDSDVLPWPELKKLTPSKLTRTASDLMREWHGGDELDARNTSTEV